MSNTYFAAAAHLSLKSLKRCCRREKRERERGGGGGDSGRVTHDSARAKGIKRRRGEEEKEEAEFSLKFLHTRRAKEEERRRRRQRRRRRRENLNPTEASTARFYTQREAAAAGRETGDGPATGQPALALLFLQLSCYTYNLARQRVFRSGFSFSSSAAPSIFHWSSDSHFERFFSNLLSLLSHLLSLLLPLFISHQKNFIVRSVHHKSHQHDLLFKKTARLFNKVDCLKKKKDKKNHSHPSLSLLW